MTHASIWSSFYTQMHLHTHIYNNNGQDAFQCPLSQNISGPRKFRIVDQPHHQWRRISTKGNANCYIFKLFVELSIYIVAHELHVTGKFLLHNNGQSQMLGMALCKAQKEVSERKISKWRIMLYGLVNLLVNWELERTRSGEGLYMLRFYNRWRWGMFERSLLLLRRSTDYINSGPRNWWNGRFPLRIWQCPIGPHRLCLAEIHRNNTISRAK